MLLGFRGFGVQGFRASGFGSSLLQGSGVSNSMRN